MKKKYIKPACGLTATAYCAPIAASIDFSNDGSTNSNDDNNNGNYGGTTSGTWAASKGNGFNVWDTDDED